MKQPPNMQKLEEILRSSKLVAGGFMGTDSRNVYEVIDNDSATLLKLGFTAQQLAARMQQITDKAKTALGEWVKIDDKRKAKVDEAKGFLLCPWPHPGRFDKRVTTVQLLDSQQTVFWSDLNIHLIAEHGFFEGKGSAYRIDPKELVKIIF